MSVKDGFHTLVFWALLARAIKGWFSMYRFLVKVSVKVCFVQVLGKDICKGIFLQLFCKCIGKGRFQTIDSRASDERFVKGAVKDR